VRAALRSYVLLDPDPKVVLDRLDRMVCTLGVPEQIVTLAYVLVSPERDELSFGFAGHVPPALVTPGVEPWFLDLDAGPPLGVGVPAAEPIRVPLPAGSVLVLCSDGLVETRSRPLCDGLDLLRQVLEKLDPLAIEPRELCRRLIEELTLTGVDDDVAVLALASRAERDLHTATLELPADRTAPRRARRFLQDRLSEWDVERDLWSSATLCLSELVTNAVLHSNTQPRISVHLDHRRLRAVVNDGGQRGAVRRRDAAVDDLAGRGLAIVDALASAWDSERGSDGTTVWFELERQPVA
jgi:anti-sigma regulatory factor (Ser/Thr protein kinase)